MGQTRGIVGFEEARLAFPPVGLLRKEFSSFGNSKDAVRTDKEPLPAPAVIPVLHRPFIEPALDFPEPPPPVADRRQQSSQQSDL